MKTKLFFTFITFLCLSTFGQIELVKDIYPGEKDSNVNFLGTYKNDVYFTAVPTSFFPFLYKYDGNQITQIKDENEMQ